MNLNYSTLTYLAPIKWPLEFSTWCNPYDGRLAATQDMSLPYGRYSINKQGGNSLREARTRNLILRENNYLLQVSHERCSGSIRSRFCGGPYEFRQDNMLNGTGGNYPIVPTIDYPGDAFFLKKFLENWRQSDFNVGVAVGEGRETLSSIAHAGEKLYKAARAIRKGNFSYALRNLSRVTSAAKRDAARALEVGDLASTWMALRYGWTPLLGDIGALRDLRYTYSSRKKITASHWEKKPITAYDSNQLVKGYTKHAWKWIAFLKLEEPDPNLMDRLGLTDPYSIAWELVPFSFVVDWFLPVGRLLDAIAAVRLVPVSSITKVDFSKTDYRLTPGPGITESRTFVSSSGDMHVSSATLRREVNQPMPTLWDVYRADFYPKRFNVKQDTLLKRAVDSVMMGANQIKKLEAGSSFRR